MESTQTNTLTASAVSTAQQRAAFRDYRREKALAAIAQIQRCYREGRPIPTIR